MIRKKEIYSYIIAFIVMLAMSITIYLLTREDDTAYSSVFNRESLIETEIGVDQNYVLNTYVIELEIDKVTSEIDKMTADVTRVSLDYATLVEEIEVIKNNLDWLSKTTAFGTYTRKMLQELPQSTNIESF